VDKIDNDLVREDSFGNVDNDLVNQSSFGKIMTNPGENAAFGKVVSFGNVIDNDLVTVEPFGKVDITNKVITEDEFNPSKLIERTQHINKEEVKMLPKGDKIKDHDAIGNILSMFASNVSTHKVNQKTLLHYAHDIVSSGEKYIVSKICEDQRNLHYKLLFDQLENLEVDFHLLLSMLTNSLTRTQQNNFGEILNMVNMIFVKKEIAPITNQPSNYDHLKRCI
jgi:hypothetical protein